MNNYRTLYALVCIPFLCSYAQLEQPVTLQEVIRNRHDLPSLRQLLIDREASAQNLLPTARQLTAYNLEGKPTWRYIGWLQEDWDGHTWNWEQHRHKYPYYYYRYYPRYSHLYPYIPYYDYWYQPTYEYSGRSVLLDELRLRDKYRHIEYKVVGMIAHLNINDGDRRLELKRAISRLLVELDRIKERIYYLREP